MNTMTDRKAVEIARRQMRSSDAFAHIAARLREPAGVLKDAAIIAGWEAKADAIERGEADSRSDIDFGKAQQLRDCAAELRARVELAAPQPPAEEQAQGGGEVVYHVPAEAWKAAAYIIGGEDDEWCDADLFVGEHVNDDGSVGYGLLIRSADYPEEGVVPLVELDRPSTAPPSAPVGVEEMLAVAEKAWKEHQTACRFTTVSGSLKKVCEALAQQPAAVDEAMVERATTAYLQSRGTYEGEVPVDRDDIRAALTAAIAAQPGGSDNE